MRVLLAQGRVQIAPFHREEPGIAVPRLRLL
jgi:hypothetical protein